MTELIYGRYYSMALHHSWQTYRAKNTDSKNNTIYLSLANRSTRHMNYSENIFAKNISYVGQGATQLSQVHQTHTDALWVIYCKHGLDLATLKF